MPGEENYPLSVYLNFPFDKKLQAMLCQRAGESLQQIYWVQIRETSNKSKQDCWSELGWVILEKT